MADRWTLLVHGGAGMMTRERLTPEQDAGSRAGLNAALDAGAAILAAGGDALDAVAAAVCVLEDDPHFNAGRGAALNWDGAAELDAAIMDGRERKAGAVAGATTARSPVDLARAIMDEGTHVLLSGAGADAFSLEQGLAQAGSDWFVLPERAAQLDELKARGGTFDVEMKYGTVGAVACDTHGHVAAATSTGGVTGKRWGRIGDSPLIGAGTYADDRSGAISATGSGEFFIRAGVAHEICARARLTGEPLQAAADAVMADVRALGGSGGVIVTGPGGDAVWSFTTLGMNRGRVTSSGDRIVAIYGDEESSTDTASEL
jgi:beta-aspartyl-peptidase (threonine type)